MWSLPERRMAMPASLRVVAMPVTFNEEKKIGSVLDRFHPGDVERIVVVDDGSTDGTPETIASRGAGILRHPVRRGVGAAIRTGINWARLNGFDVAVIVAGNDKDRPQEIPRLLKPILEDGCHLVQGSRYLSGGSYGNMPAYRRVATQALHPYLLSALTRHKMTDSTNGFRAIRLDLFDDPRINLQQDWLDRYELEPYILYKALTLGYRVREVPVTKIYPSADLGYTKMKPITGWWQMLSPLFMLATGLRR
jgi:dolichol-phosphate mannosyltransferase